MNSYFHAVVEDPLNYHIENDGNNHHVVTLIKSTEEDLQDIKIQMEAQYGIAEIHWELTGSSAIPNIDETACLPEKFKEVVTNPSNALQLKLHHAPGCKATLHPYLLGKDLYVLCDIALEYQDHVKFDYACTIMAPGNQPPLEAKIIEGVSYDPTRQLDSVTRGYTIGAEVGVTGHVPAAKVTMDHSKSTTTDLPHFESVHVPSVDERSGIHIRYKLRGRYSTIVVPQRHLLLFNLAKDFKPSELRLDSVFVKHYPTLEKAKNLFSGRVFPATTFSRSFFGLDWIPESGGIVIGGVVGKPRAGKTSFIKAIFSSLNIIFSSAFEETPAVQRYNFRGVQINGSPVTFAFVDTRGYFFNINEPKSVEILERFIQGVREGTKFEEGENFGACADTRNATSHLLLAVNARSLWVDTAYSMWFWVNSKQQEAKAKKAQKLEAICSLYGKLVELLAEKRYKGNTIEAKKRVYVLITHMDMIPINQNAARTSITSTLSGKGIPPNLVVFAQKTCAWNEADLSSHEDEVDKFFASVPKDVEWFKHARALNKDRGFPHITDDKCINKETCTHDYPDYVIQSFKGLLNQMLST